MQGIQDLTKKNVLYVTNIPSPNRVLFFNEFGKYCKLTVTFELPYASDRDKKWKPEKIRNFKAVNLKGVRTSADSALCPDLIRVLNRQWECVIFGAYYTPTSMLGMQYMMLKKRPYIIEADGGFIKSEKKIKKSIKTHFISNAQYWLTSGKKAVEYLSHYGADESRCGIFPFTSVRQEDICNIIINEREYLQRREESRRHLGVADELVILTVGQFIHRKGIDILLGAAGKSKAGAEYYIVGGEATDEYLELAKGNPKIHFEGFKYGKKLSAYFYAADLFVLPTREDIWGLVINEAFAYGLPVITTDRCGAGVEMITDGKEGFIVPIGDSKAIARIIDIFRGNGEKLKAMSRNAAKKSLGYTIEKMSDYHVEFIREYCKGMWD